jgi:hypothetical protein
VRPNAGLDDPARGQRLDTHRDWKGAAFASARITGAVERARSDGARPASDRRRSLRGPLRAWLAVLTRWGLDDADAAALLGAESASVVKALRLGVAGRWTRDMRDRVRCALEIHEVLHGLFRNPSVEREWLRERRASLGERSPLDVLRDGSMEGLLFVRDYLQVIAGR